MNDIPHPMEMGKKMARGKIWQDSLYCCINKRLTIRFAVVNRTEGQAQYIGEISIQKS